MNLFDTLVQEALNNRPELSSLKMVVEKELLHQDIFRILSQHNLLEGLTFIGGTALRSCYGGIRLSEDLNFTGGHNFSRDKCAGMAEILTTDLHQKYGLRVTVQEPTQDKSNVDTWKIRIKTRPSHKHQPMQRIHIDICALPSYEAQARTILNPYNVDMGTSGLVIQTQSREEIYTDKLVAFALRPNRIKHRDLWDITWLHQQGLTPRLSLISDKIQDRKRSKETFLLSFKDRIHALSDDESIEGEFIKEMQRFLSADKVKEIAGNNKLWPSIIHLMNDLHTNIQTYCQSN